MSKLLKKKTKPKSKKQASSPQNTEPTKHVPETYAWDTGFKPITSCPYMSPPTVFVPMELALLAKKYDPYTEYMLYARASIDSDVVVVEPDFCVPRQRASSARVENLGGCDDYNAVVHKHPSGVRQFSGTDDTYINANNDLSILLEGGRIAEVVVRRRLPCGHTAIVRAEPVIYTNTTNIKELMGRVEVLIKELEEKTVDSYYSYGYHYRVAKKNNDSDGEDWRWSL